MTSATLRITLIKPNTMTSAISTMVIVEDRGLDVEHLFVPVDTPPIRVLGCVVNDSEYVKRKLKLVLLI